MSHALGGGGMAQSEGELFRHLFIRRLRDVEELRGVRDDTSPHPVTGVGALAVGTVAKRLQLLHELVPAAGEVAFLRNPTNPYFGALETRELQAAATVLGVRLLLLDASSSHEIDAAFVRLVARARLICRSGLCSPARPWVRKHIG
jgi:ABC-type uncharacterized transport system substrate-binding protein